ncbi:MAG: hypothetical protein JNL74_20905 [Fibrobacteres bacterium]|nr:hypothetical protein [Fibrobacterota bacterium]
MQTNYDYSAYWISPEGDIIPVPDCHISVVIRDPETFGLTTAIVDRIHKKHSEPLHTEGNARIEIITALIKKRWIRLRLVTRDYSWTIQCNKLDESARQHLSKWAQYAINNKSAKKDMAVYISNEDGTYLTDRSEPIFISALARLTLMD